MNRPISIAALTAVLLATSSAFAQSSSLYLRGQVGQFGSNQPNVMLVVEPPQAPATAQPRQAGAGATSAAQGNSQAGLPPAGPTAAAPPEPTGQPGQTGLPPGYASGPPGAPAPSLQVRTYPLIPAAGGRDATVSPAAAALQQVSFTATAPPAPRTFQVHDLVTIIVREETSFSSDGETDTEKKFSIDAELEEWIKLRLGNLQVVPTAMADGTPQIKGSADRKFEGDGWVTRRDTFIGRLTAEIIDIKPNGTLVLSARKFIKTDGEEQRFELTGTCRTQDINADNTVLSTQLADLTVTKMHKGAVRDSTKRGWAPWLTDKINPW